MPKPSPKTPGKRQQRSIETRARILAAAARAFSIVGFDGASIRDIAAQAGVKHQNISFHFGNKEQLWLATASHLFTELRAQNEVASYDDDRDLREQFTEHIRKVVTYTAHHPELIRIIYQESINPSPRLAQLAQQNEMTESSADVHMKRLRQAGYFVNSRHEDLMYVFGGLVNGRVLQAILSEQFTGLPIHHPSVIEGHVKAITSVVLSRGPVTMDAPGIPPPMSTPDGGRRGLGA